MAEIDPSPARPEAGAETVLAQGEVPFAILDDGRVVRARFRTTYTPQPVTSLSDPEATRWTLVLDGREFTPVATDADDQSTWLPIEDGWARGRNEPLVAVADGPCHVVRYEYFYAHHLGWLTGPVTLRLDETTMTVGISRKLEFDPD